MKPHRFLPFALCALFGLFSCRQEISVPQYDTQTELSIDRYPDSSFFSDIRCMQYADGKIYALDAKRRDVAVLDPGFRNLATIGTGGSGPAELLSPAVFYVNEDTVGILDFGAGGIKNFVGSRCVEKKELPTALDKRFFCREGVYYIPSVREKGVFYTLNRNVAPEQHTYHGQPVSQQTVRRTLIRNQRHLLMQGEHLYAVPDALPIVEKYDLTTKALLESCDLSDIPVFRENLRFIAAQEEEEKSYYVLVQDACLGEDWLYLLCNSLGKNYRCNTLVEVTLQPRLRVSAVYLLPGESYAAFCIAGNEIFAFNSRQGTLERIRKKS